MSYRINYTRKRRSVSLMRSRYLNKDMLLQIYLKTLTAVHESRMRAVIFVYKTKKNARDYNTMHSCVHVSASHACIII